MEDPSLTITGHQGSSPDASYAAPRSKVILEALLFVSSEPLTLAAFVKATGMTEKDVRQGLEELIHEYRERQSAISIVEIAGGYQMTTDPELGLWITRLKNITISTRLSQPALETLSIIAYKQPITKAEIDQLRGVNSDAAVRSLAEKRLIKIVGKKEAPGRPFLYATTQEFLRHFGLTSLNELPPLNSLYSAQAA